MAVGIIRNLGSFAGGGTKVPSPLIPIMTSNTTPSGYVASASSEFSTGYRAFMSFTNNLNNLWASGQNAYTNSWLKIQLAESKVCKCFSLQNPLYDNDNSVKAFTLSASNDDSAYMVLGSFTNPNNIAGNRTVFYLDNSVAYKYYRLTVASKYGSGNYCTVGSLQLYDADVRTYLYKDGKQNVPWDNSGYILADNYTCDGGATLNEGNLTLIMPPTNYHNRTIVSNSVVDVSEYSTLKVGYAYNNTYHELSVNVSSIGVGGYVSINTHRSSTGAYIFDVVLSTSKSFPINNQLARTYLDIGNHNVTVSRIWLEK